MRHVSPPANFPHIITLAFLTISPLLVGCHEKTESTSPPPPMEVSVTKVITQTVPSYYDYVGTTQAIRSVVIQARVEGFLTERHYVEGTDVEKDALLYVIEPEPYQKTLAEQTAELASKKAEAWDASLEATRFKNLLDKASTSQSNYDRRRAKSDSAKAQVDLTDASKDKAAIRLGYCTVKAPFAGRIGRTQVHVGNLVGADETTPLTTIVQLDPIYTMFNTPAKYIATMAEMHAQGNLNADVFLEDDSGNHYKGKVDFINNAVDPETSTVLVRAVVQNPKKILLPGQYANVRMFLRPIENAVFVPANVILQQQGGQFVYVIDKDNKVTLRTVVPGQNYNQMCLIKEGLKPGETIAIDKLQRLRPEITIVPKMQEPQKVETPALGNISNGKDPKTSGSKGNVDRG